MIVQSHGKPLEVPGAFELPLSAVVTFPLPLGLPAGSPKLRLTSLGNASKGDLVVGLVWNGVDEGTISMSWVGPDYLEGRIPLDGASLTAGTTLEATLAFSDTSTMAMPTTHQPTLIWE